MVPLVDFRGLEKGMQEQKKQTEPCETVRMHSSFLFAGTAEGALCRILLLAHFSDTHTVTHSLNQPVPFCHRQTQEAYATFCACANTHMVLLIATHKYYTDPSASLKML